MTRLLCWIFGHWTDFKHPQMKWAECQRCRNIVDRDGAVVQRIN